MNLNIILFTVLFFICPVKLKTKIHLLLVPIDPQNWRHSGISYFRVTAHAPRQLDIQSYEEPTEIPDVDNFEYKDRIGSQAAGRKSDRNMDFDDVVGDDKIIGGNEVEINLYPYHVAYGSNCGGAIIGPKWILTAGHCGQKSYVKAGSKYFGKGRKYEVENSYIHPNWTQSKKEHPFDYDFQLVKLSTPLTFDYNTQPIKIGRIKDMLTGKVISVTGWGNTEEDGPYSDVLRAIRIPIISKQKCQLLPFPYFKGTLTMRMFCAGYQEASKDACQGDSGGPAVSEGRLLGMVSFGYGCATPGSYGVYSKVSTSRSWIHDVTGLELD